MSPSLPYSIVANGDDKNITIFVPGMAVPQVAHSSHQNFEAIVAAAETGTVDGLLELFDVGITVSEKFAKLSERVSVNGGTIFFDGDPIDDSLTAQVIRFLDEGTDDWKPLVNFYEKVQANPSEHSREQLYEWLSSRDFTIDEAGDLIAYKGVRSSGEGYTSLHQGHAVVDGVPMNGYVPYAVGSIVEMPRSSVNQNPSEGCSTGLHVGTHEYAQRYAYGGCMLRVSVNPRDVVSVPTDCDAQKVRVCRLKVEDIIVEKCASALYQEPVKYIFTGYGTLPVGTRCQAASGKIWELDDGCWVLLDGDGDRERSCPSGSEGLRGTILKPADWDVTGRPIYDPEPFYEFEIGEEVNFADDDRAYCVTDRGHKDGVERYRLDDSFWVRRSEISAY